MKYAIDKINVFQTGWSAIVLNIGVLNCYLRNPFKVQARLAMGSSVSHCWRSFHRAIERILLPRGDQAGAGCRCSATWILLLVTANLLCACRVPNYQERIL